VAHDVIRILSDLHFGDRSSRLASLSALAPLLDGVSHLVLNGDTLDTRPSHDPAASAALRSEVTAFFGQQTPPVTLITGNHDPDLSPHHSLDLAGGQILVTHGDILFDDLVPWSRDAPIARRLIAAELAQLPPASRDRLEDRLAAFRRAAYLIPQRHQAERHGLKYAVSYLADTVWPPLRMLRVLRAWRETPARASDLLRRHRPRARFLLMGHVHRPGAWRRPDGLVILNTGAFGPPVGPAVIDISPRRLVLRRVEHRGGAFHAGSTIAEFALADVGAPATLLP
jgi:predicted phosphodiesterase